MFSDHMGFRETTAIGEVLHVRRGAVGHASHGPYDHVRPGEFKVDFTLALDPAAPPGSDEVCATIDIAAYRGGVILVSRHIRLSELSAQPRTFSLPLVNREFRSLEYRVASTGIADLIVGHPRLVRLGEVKHEQPPADPNDETDDPVELQRQLRAVLRLLRPQRVKGFGKIRMGNAGDGGYVCIDDFNGQDVALSLGINDDISWDVDAADRGLTIHQFDHTVDDPAPSDPRMIFNKKMIATHSSADTASLSDLIRQHDRGETRPNMVLKMDIEGAEWPALDATSSEELSRFSQILCELHCFGELGEVGARRRIYKELSKIAEHYAVAHVHGNSCGGLVTIANLTIPQTIEFTFVNRKLYELEDTDELFPGPMDISCDAYNPDLYLGSFRF